LLTQTDELRKARLNLRNMEGEVRRAQQNAKAQAPGGKELADLEYAKRTYDNMAMHEQQIRDEIAKAERETENQKILGLKGEEVRTKERVPLRQELLAAEERVSQLERKQARQYQRATEEYERAARGLHGDGGPASDSST